jgi:ABC-type Mn2+/Zn2+ transport system ATPase subunit
MKKISFENITFGYQPKQPLVEDLSFTFQNPTEDKGYVIALMGASGAGKSTILKLMLGTERPQKGTITTSPENPIIAYLPQEPVLFEHLSPLANARYFATTAFYKKRFDESIFADLVQSLQMQEVLAKSKSVLELSGGQRQRLSLLRALSIKPDFLLLDEPTTGLDAEVKLQFLHKLRELVMCYNLLVVYVTHHKLETELIVDEIAYIAKNADTNRINKIFTDSVSNFIKSPPLLEAVKVFNYPKPNLIQARMEAGKLIPTLPVESTCTGVITDENLVFSETEGFAYRILTSNPIYTLLELTDTKQTIALNTSSLPTQLLDKVAFVGKMSQYDKKNVLINHFLNT